jgi:hypothetical protein
MNRFLYSAFLGATLAVGASMTASAAPLSPLPGTPSTESGIEKVHDFHRSCRRGHRHTSDGDRVRCGSYYRRDSSPGITLQLGTRDRHDRRDRDHRRDRHDRR